VDRVAYFGQNNTIN